LILGKGATLSIIKSEHDFIFAYYTSLPWKIDYGNYSLSDNKSFIYSATHSTIHRPEDTTNMAHRNRSDNLLVIGEGPDIDIVYECNEKNCESYFNNGTFVRPANLNDN
jgi:hypothetical protein